MTGLEMRKLIDTGICPNCKKVLQEHSVIADILSSGKCSSCHIQWDGWATPGNQQTEATLWLEPSSPTLGTN